ncbi:Uncharacterised protein g6873 [Pycnogonum litorale]
METVEAFIHLSSLLSLYFVTVLKNVFHLMSNRVNRRNGDKYIPCFIYGVNIVYLTSNMLQTFVKYSGNDDYLLICLYFKHSFVVYVNFVLITLFVCTTVVRKLFSDRHLSYDKLMTVSLMTSLVCPILIIYSMIVNEWICFGNIFDTSYIYFYYCQQHGSECYVWDPLICNRFNLMLYLCCNLIYLVFLQDYFVASFRATLGKILKITPKHSSSTGNLKNVSDEIETIRCEAEEQIIKLTLHVYIFMQLLATANSLISDRFPPFLLNLDAAYRYVGIVNFFMVDMVIILSYVAQKESFAEKEMSRSDIESLDSKMQVQNI